MKRNQQEGDQTLKHTLVDFCVIAAVAIVMNVHGVPKEPTGRFQMCFKTFSCGSQVLAKNNLTTHVFSTPLHINSYVITGNA